MLPKRTACPLGVLQGNRSVTSLAREHGVSRTQVRRALQSSAMATLQIQKDEIINVLQLAERRGLELFYDSMRWDETQQVLTLDLCSLAENNQASWNLMVCKRRLAWTYSGETRVHSMDIIMLPVILVGAITADSFCDALLHTRQAAVIERFIGYMRRAARMSMAIREGDSDSKNLRLMEWEKQQPHMAAALHSFAPCMLHQTNLMIGSAVKHSKGKFIDGMYAYSRLLRMGNYFMRTVLAVQAVVSSILRVLPNTPSEETRILNEVAFDFFVLPPRSRKHKPVSEKQKQQFKDLRKEYLMMCNGNPFSQNLVHHCHASVNCGCQGNRAVVVGRVSRILIRTLYCRRPAIPQLKEWTSVWESLSWLAAGLVRNRVAASIFECSVGATPAVVQAAGDEVLQLVPAAQIADAKPAVQDFLDGMSWHEMASVRVKYVRQHVMQPIAHLDILLLAILTGAEEPCFCIRVILTIEAACDRHSNCCVCNPHTV